MKLFWLAIGLLSFSLAQAAPSRFIVERHPDLGVVIKFQAPKPDVEKWYKQQLQALSSEQSLLATQGMEMSQAQLAQELGVLNGSLPQSLIQRGLVEAHNLDLVNLEGSISSSLVLVDFKEKLKEFLVMLDPRVLAVENDSIFFLKTALLTDLLEKALDAAQKQFPASKELVLLQEVMRMLIDRVHFERSFGQNMLMIAMMENQHKDLNLSDSETKHLLSSIFSSRVNLMLPQVQKDFKANWETKGTQLYLAMAEEGKRRDQIYKTDAKSWDSFNSWYRHAERDQSSLIVDLMHTPRMFKKGAAVVYDYAKPNRIYGIRMLLRIAELGLSFADIPQTFKSYGQKYLRSYYFEQIRSEGALISSLEDQDQNDVAKIIWAQSFFMF